MPDPCDIRVDKWLWATRLFKTRTLATEACRAGHVRIDAHPIKPSRNVRVGETLTIRQGKLNRTVQVVQLLEKRVAAKVVPEYVKDLTPTTEYQKSREAEAPPAPSRPRGFGRPTKKQRRELERWLVDNDE